VIFISLQFAATRLDAKEKEWSSWTAKPQRSVSNKWKVKEVLDVGALIQLKLH
jgi:hypothetical protein